ncbi:MAG: energy transducer TonB [Rudaea sp.]|nr:energy transducer TonB [Rudaea sp.]
MRLPILLGLPLLALACGAQAAETTPQPVKLTLEWNLSIDAQGHVTRLDAVENPRASPLPQVREKLDQAIRGWRFTPGTIDGQGEPTNTLLVVAVALLPQGGDAYRIRVDDARTGGRIAKAVPPHYPYEAVHNYTSGMVVVRAEYDASGRVTSATLEQGAPAAPTSLTKAAIDAVRHWTFQPERVGGRGVAGTDVFPVCFSVMPLGAKPPATNCNWTPPGHAIAIGEGQALALGPATQLLTEVAGQTL